MHSVDGDVKASCLFASAMQSQSIFNICYILYNSKHTGLNGFTPSHLTNALINDLFIKTFPASNIIE